MGAGRHSALTALVLLLVAMASGAERGGIPKMVHITAKDCNNLPFKHVWQQNAPDWELKCWDHAAMTQFVSQEWPSYLELFESIERISQSDLFRYMLIFNAGGCYADSDFEPYPAFGGGIADEELIIGYEAFFTTAWERNRWSTMRPRSLSMWTFCAAPRHPYIRTLIGVVAEKVKTPFPGGDYRTYITTTSGPVVFSDVLLGLYERSKEKVRLLDISAFGCGQEHSHSPRCSPDDSRQWGRHHFHNSWLKRRLLLL